ncbi:MAG: class I SAM-dependent methyltransferase [Anaerolineaceae bacterium]|nr:class I SAM-dependent methyltransferase [Anaerolineaceae bacterium]
MSRYLQPSAELRERILTQGGYAPEENRRIYDKWFSHGPRLQFQAASLKYDLTGKVMCDIGCGYGMNLVYTQPGSYGIEVDSYAVQFARSIGLTMHSLDFMHDDISHLPKVDVVWCSALLEHVESIHIFLRRISFLLKPNGLLFIYVPTIPLIPALRHVTGLKRFTTGYLYSDHINAFTPSTLRFFCERAGYETAEVSPFMPGVLGAFNHVPLLNRLVDGCTYVGRRIPDWEYPEHATRRVASSGVGFEYKASFVDTGLLASSRQETPVESD